MAEIVFCPNCGEYYDGSKSGACPKCGGAKGFPPTQGIGGFGVTTDVTGGVPGGFGVTMDVTGGAGGFPPTQDVNGGASGGFPPTQNITGSSGRMGVTEMISPGSSSDAPAPVVGWLVAVEGPCRGTDYRIHTGYNNIGRERGDICIRGDKTISAEKDSTITYVHQTRKFYIAHLQGKNVLLVNGIPAIGNGIELNSYDRISIGNTELLFIALCGEKFSWENREKTNA